MAGNDYTLNELLDLALGTPEIGAVNFNILHRLLRAVLTRLDMSEIRVHVDLQWPTAADSRNRAGSPLTPTTTTTASSSTQTDVTNVTTVATSTAVLSWAVVRPNCLLG